jgi:type II secretory pathway pseudopilin PulG
MLAAVVVLAIPCGLLPVWVQRTREAAQLRACQNNLKEIGLALHNYHATCNHLPPGAVNSPLYPGNTTTLFGVYYATSPSVGPLAFLLPYMGQKAIYDEIPANFFDLKSNLPAWAYGTAPFDTNPSPIASPGPNYTGIPTWCQNRIYAYECPAAVDNPFNSEVGGCGVIDCHFLCPYAVSINGQLSPAPGANSAVLDWLDYLPPTSPLSLSQGFLDVNNIALTSYVANAGTAGPCDMSTTLYSYLQSVTANFTDPAPGPNAIYSNTLNIPGAPGGPGDTMLLWQYYGPFGVNSQTRFTDIQDGTSNTVAFGETLGGRQFTDGTTDFKIAWAAGYA